MQDATPYAALHSAADDGDLETVKRFFTQPDVLENVANCNALHRRIRLGELSPLDFIPLYSGGWVSADLFGSHIVPRSHVDMFRWFFAREQRQLFEERLRALGMSIALSCIERGVSSTAREMIEIFFESPLFKETMGEEERRRLLQLMMLTASDYGRDKWVGMLLAYGADPSCRWKFSAPLRENSYQENAKTLKVLVANGTWMEGSRLLLPLAQGPAEVLVGDLLRYGADANAMRREGGSVLHEAARQRHQCSVQLLVEEGFVDVDARDHRGRTPLMEAAAVSVRAFGPPPSHEITQLLLDAGADIHAVDNKRRGVLHHTVNNKQEGAPLQAVRGWSPNCLRLFLERGANPNLQDVHGRTPLTILVTRARGNIHGNIKEMLTLLLQAGADPFIRDNRGHFVSHMLRRSETGLAFMHENPVSFTQCARQADSGL